MTETKNLRSVEEMSADHLAQGIESRVRRLRALVGEIEREAKRTLNDAREGRTAYGRVVQNIEHSITWGVANLNLPTLMSTATDADIAHAKGE